MYFILSSIYYIIIIIIIIMCIPYITIVNERAKKKKKCLLLHFSFSARHIVQRIYISWSYLYYQAWTNNIDAISSSTSVEYTKETSKDES